MQNPSCFLLELLSSSCILSYLFHCFQHFPLVHVAKYTIIIMTEVSFANRMKLAVEAFHRGQYKSKRACARAFDVPPRTLQHRLNGMKSRKESATNCRKLTDVEEHTLSKWILNVQRGQPLQVSDARYLAQLLLSARLGPSQEATIGVLWVNRFIQRHPELSCEYTRK